MVIGKKYKDNYNDKFRILLNILEHNKVKTCICKRIFFQIKDVKELYEADFCNKVGKPKHIGVKTTIVKNAKDIVKTSFSDYLVGKDLNAFMIDITQVSKRYEVLSNMLGLIYDLKSSEIPVMFELLNKLKNNDFITNELVHDNSEDLGYIMMDLKMELPKYKNEFSSLF